jgi:hypothetical protein
VAAPELVRFLRLGEPELRLGAPGMLAEHLHRPVREPRLARSREPPGLGGRPPAEHEHLDAAVDADQRVIN